MNKSDKIILGSLALLFGLAWWRNRNSQSVHLGSAGKFGALMPLDIFKSSSNGKTKWFCVLKVYGYSEEGRIIRIFEAETRKAAKEKALKYINSNNLI